MTRTYIFLGFILVACAPSTAAEPAPTAYVVPKRRDAHCDRVSVKNYAWLACWNAAQKGRPGY